MDVNKEPTHQQTNQNTRPIQHLKRNKCPKRGIPSKAVFNTKNNQSTQHQAIIQFIDDPTLSQSEQSRAKMKKYDHLFCRGSNTDPTLFFSDYSLISNMAFKEMLLTETIGVAGDNTDINSLVKSLNTEEIWTFTRQLTQLINQLNYFKLQEEQWAHYYHLGVTEGIWTGRVSKRMARDNTMCYTYGRRKHIIEQRLKKFQQQLLQIKSDIDEHMTQTPLPVIDSNRIETIVTVLVDKDQYQLRGELERRRDMLYFDAKDHKCIQAFYDLKPSQAEVSVNIFSIHILPI
jgi:hypothetical protein